jgi:hypothetical protein
LIVVVSVAVVAAYANRERIRLKIASVYATVPPKAAQEPTPSQRGVRPFRGDAPWAFSALPECFRPVSKSIGPLKYVLAHLPKGSIMVPAPAIRYFSDCTVRVKGDEVEVERGVDRLRIPPPVRLYESNNLVTLLRGLAGTYEMRTYATHGALTI